MVYTIGLAYIYYRMIDTNKAKNAVINFAYTNYICMLYIGWPGSKSLEQEKKFMNE